MKLRKHWKWAALIAAVVVAVALWFGSVDATAVATTLHLRQPWEAGLRDDFQFMNQRSFWIDVRWNRIIGCSTTNYSIEAHTPAGWTNYDAQLGPGGPFEPFGGIHLPGGAVPVRVAAPIDADEFRVKMVIEEHGAFYSEFLKWAVYRGTVGNRFELMVCNWIFRLPSKGVPTTVWSPWIVRSNSEWMEKAER
jgi:hypothetical protein